MSDYLKTPLYHGRGLENQLRNTLYNTHELACGCKTPATHMIHLLNAENNEEKQLCLPSTVAAGDGEPVQKEGLGELEWLDGDLTALFDEELTEDNIW